MAYTLVLLAHSWIRWIALIGGVGATLTALSGSGPGAAARADRWGLIFMIALDVQMLLGLLLYFALSPFTTEALHDFGAAMRNPALRFWAVEHAFMMVLVVILAHVGRVLGRKAKTPESKRSRTAACFGFATIVMLLAIPWPGLPNGRPLFRY
jgi:hypothetical protein